MPTLEIQQQEEQGCGDTAGGVRLAGGYISRRSKASEIDTAAALYRIQDFCIYRILLYL
jgi:hypothetical protein